MSITISSPDVWARPAAPSTNVPTSALEPEFEVQAKFLFSVPPSLRHSVHRMPTPAAAATVADIARSRPHSRVTLFIVCLRDLFTERGLGGVLQARASANDRRAAHVVV